MVYLDSKSPKFPKFFSLELWVNQSPLLLTYINETECQVVDMLP